MSVMSTITKQLAGKFIDFLETGQPPHGLFAPDVFCDYTMPLWRLQAGDAEELVALRRHGHPSPGLVTSARLDDTDRGFVLEVEEQWDEDGQSWYSRELFRADVDQGAIAALTVYCTGDWTADQVERHRRAVTLLRP